MQTCPYCGMYHPGACLRLKEAEFNPDGTIKRVVLKTYEELIGKKPKPQQEAKP